MLRTAMWHDSHKMIAIAIIALSICLFCLDLYLPLGIGNGVLYGCLVLLSFLLPSRRGPLLTAAVCSVLSMADVIFSPTLQGVPIWMGVSNRLFSLTAIWLPVLFFLHRRRAEETLRQAHDELDTRVRVRTQELAELNKALRVEISERRDTERSLRASEAELQVNQQELNRSREELRALAGKLLTAQEEDRRRISRDLHDDINQRLAMISMDLRRVEKSLANKETDLRAIMRSISTRLTTVSDDVRQMAYRFHPSILDDLGLVKAIRRLVDDFSARSEVHVSYAYQDPSSALSCELSTCLYRVAQESLNNVQRHAQASHVDVELICEEDLVTLSISDNGCGFEMATVTQDSGRLGLLSMQERVRLMKGQLQVEATPGKGTHVHVMIPLRQGLSYE